MSKELKLALVISRTAKAQGGAADLRDAHPWVPVDEADVLVVLGGDGFMLHVLHRMLDEGRVVPAFGINLGTVGFLMNRLKNKRSIAERVARARNVAVVPLEMVATSNEGEQSRYYAINEVSLLRETRMTAKLQLKVNGKIRMAELSGDGVLLATPAGSTAYNLSANGPILPLGSNMLALTPLSPFRPRRWKGAILPDHYEVEFKVLDPENRPVAVVADQHEVRDVASVCVKVAREKQLTLLFDPNQSLEERIFAEQFLV